MMTKSLNKKYERKYMRQLLIAVDQGFNALFAGYADETLSARAWRMKDKKRRWKIVHILIDALFFFEKDHCFNAYLSEMERKHLPKEYND